MENTNTTGKNYNGLTRTLDLGQNQFNSKELSLPGCMCTVPVFSRVSCSVLQRLNLGGNGKLLGRVMPRKWHFLRSLLVCGAVGRDFDFFFFFLRKLFAVFEILGHYRAKKAGLPPSCSAAFLLVYLFQVYRMLIHAAVYLVKKNG